jgi:glycosyltransferase involved in cell wall biosynthesis
VQITVVIPVFNHAEFAKEAIESVLSQGYSDLELIVVDDGSNDPATTRFLASLQGYDRVRLFRQRNLGPAIARNHGLRRATGEAILFLDADDILLPGALTTLADARRCHPDRIAHAGFAKYMSADGRRLIGTTGQTPLSPQRDQIRSASMAPWPPSACLVSTEAARTIGGFNEEYSSTPGFPEDLDFWSRLAEVGEFFVVKQAVCAYRVHHGSKSAVNARVVETWTAYLQYVSECRCQNRPHLSFSEWRDQSDLRLQFSDYGRLAYRRAGLAFVNRRYASALAFATVAAVCHPRYAITRFRQQVTKL